MRQLSGQQLAKQGLTRAVDKAERDFPEWREKTYRLFKRFIFQTSGPFMIEDFRSFCAMQKNFDFPNSNRAFGFVPIRAKEDGLIRRCGFRKVKNRKAHAAFASLWKKV